eukprot:jgi/Chrpa1/6041/Chrysochromulina_OHIO_Genome00015844-RA
MKRSDSWILVDENDLTTEVTAPDTPSVKKSPAVETHEPLAAVAVYEPHFSTIDAAVEVWELEELEELEAIEARMPIPVDPLPAKPKKSGKRSMPFLPFVMIIVVLGLTRLAVEALVREDSCALRTLAVASSSRSHIRLAHPARQALSMVDSPSHTTVTTARSPTALLELAASAVNVHSVQPGCDEIRWTHPPPKHAIAPNVCNRSSGSAPMSAKKVFTHWNGSWEPLEREDVLTRALLVPIPQRRWRTMADTLTERRKQPPKATSVPPSRLWRLLASHALALAPATAPRADRFALYAILPATSAAVTAIVAPIPVPTSALDSVPASLLAAAPAANQMAAAVAVVAAAVPNPALAGLQIAPPKTSTPASASASTPASASASTAASASASTAALASASTAALALAIASAEEAALEWPMAPVRRERSVQRAAFDAEMQRQWQWQLLQEHQLRRTVAAVALVAAAMSSPATTLAFPLTNDQSLQLSRLSRALALRRNTSRALVVVASTSTAPHSTRRASAPMLALTPGSVPARLLSWVPPACRDLVLSSRSLIAFSSGPARRYSNRSSNSSAQRVPLLALTARQLGGATALLSLPAPPVRALFLTSPPAPRLATAFLPPPLGVPGVTRTVAVAAEHAKQAAAVDLRLAAMCAEVRRLRRELSGAQAAIDATASQYQRTAAELEYTRSELHVQHVHLEATQTLAQVAQVRARAEAAARVHAENSRARAEAARAKADAAAKHARRRSAVLARQVRQTKRKQREQQALRKTTLEMEGRHGEPRASQRQHGNGKVGGGGRAAGKYKVRGPLRQG